MGNMCVSSCRWWVLSRCASSCNSGCGVLFKLILFIENDQISHNKNRGTNNEPPIIIFCLCI